MEIWPLHRLEGWPWILVLRFTARIRGNLPQTHILLGEIWVSFFLPQLYFKITKQGYFWTAISGYWQKGKILCQPDIFLLSFSFHVKSRLSWRQGNILIFRSMRRKDFPKVKLNSWVMWPPHKLILFFFSSSFFARWHCPSCWFMLEITELQGALNCWVAFWGGVKRCS